MKEGSEWILIGCAVVLILWVFFAFLLWARLHPGTRLPRHSRRIAQQPPRTVAQLIEDAHNYTPEMPADFKPFENVRQLADKLYENTVEDHILENQVLFSLCHGVRPWEIVDLYGKEAAKYIIPAYRLMPYEEYLRGRKDGEGH
jgi:hypothetical protein